MENPNRYDVIIIGAGAAGLMSAWQSSIGGKRVLLIEPYS
jgi:predicted flavoprotein YhiN